MPAPIETSKQQLILRIVIIATIVSVIALGVRAWITSARAEETCSPEVDPLTDEEAAQAVSGLLAANGVPACGVFDMVCSGDKVAHLADFPHCAPTDLTVLCLNDQSLWVNTTVSNVSVSEDGTEVTFTGGQEGTCALFNGPAGPTEIGRIAFVWEDALHKWQEAIYVMDGDGSNQTYLSGGVANNAAPVWSPDGTRIAFEARNYLDPEDPYHSSQDINVINADGTNQLILTDTADFHYEEDPAWSPDGQQIAFAGCGSSDCGIYVVNPDGSMVTRLTNAKIGDMYSRPSWSPDGNSIAFEAGEVTLSESGLSFEIDIYVMNSDGSDLTRLTNIPGYEFAPTWSPDGTRIAFVSSQWPNEDTASLYVMNKDGSNLTVLYNRAEGDKPAWSPDGKHIVFACNITPPYPELCVVDADGSNLFAVNDGGDRSEWSPDGAWILFSSGWEIHKVSPDGTLEIQLSEGYRAAWQP